MNSRVNLTSQENAPKLIYAGDEWLGESQPQVLVTDDSVRIMGDLDKGVVVDPQFGTLIQGPCSLADMPENIRIASYWAFNPMLLASVGSSAALNIPVLVAAQPPVLEAKKGFSKIVAG
jgi:hypothetical protein